MVVVDKNKLNFVLTVLEFENSSAIIEGKINFAAAELMGSSGKELIAGVVAGYEVSNRIAAAVQPAHYDYWHTTGTVGASVRRWRRLN